MQKEYKPVLINLLAIAKYEGMPDYPIQFMTTGRLYEDQGNGAVLRYTESQQDEDSGEVNVSDIALHIRGREVTMTRTGDFSNTMLFSKNHRYEGVYHTPYGDISMAVFSRDVFCHIEPEQGAVHLKYQLDLQGRYASSHELHLEYTLASEERHTGRKEKQQKKPQEERTEKKADDHK